MSRLPKPGGDDNIWGDLLNDFLAVEHNDDGTLKKADVITGAEQASNKGQPGGYAPLDTSGKVPSANLPAVASVGDATASSKGVIQLAGDLTGSAVAPAVASGAINGSKIAGGVIVDGHIASGANIAKSKLAPLAIGDSDVSAISETKITGLVSDLAGKTDKVTLIAKGDIYAATAAATPGRLAVGSDGTILTADSTQATGVKWTTHVVGGGNFITNPSFDDGITGWSAASGATLALNSVAGLFGSACGKVTRNTGAGTGTSSIISPRSTVAPGVAYSASGWFRLGSLGTLTARTVTVQVNWYDAVNTLLSSQTSAAVSESIQGTWETVALPNTISPDTAAKAEVQINIASVPEGEFHYFDGFQLEPGDLPTSFNANFAQSSLTGNMLAPLSITSRETATGSAKPLYGTTAAMPSAGTVGRLYWATDTNGLWFDNGTTWVLINASGSASLNGMYDFPFTYDPRAAGSTSTSALGFTTNNVYYFRLQGGGTINGLLVHQLGVGAGDGSGKVVNLALYTNTGSGRNAKPSTKISGSDLSLTGGAVASDLSANFSSPVTVSHGMWVGFSTTLSSASSLSRNATSNFATSVGDGLAWATTTGGTGPSLPATVPALSSFYLTLLVVGI